MKDKSKISKSWHKLFLELKLYLLQFGEFPDNKDNSKLNKWIGSQKIKKRRGALNNEQLRLLDSLGFPWDAVQVKWLKKYKQLETWRLNNPNKWPQYDRNNPKNPESQLGTWCRTMRKRHKEKVLDDFWTEKLSSINFNFKGKSDNWNSRFSEIRDILNNNVTSINDIGRNNYYWLRRNKTLFENGKLRDEHSKKFNELNLDGLFETWNERYENLESWIKENGKVPTRSTEKNLYSWVQSQKKQFRKGTLSEEFTEKLLSIGIDFELKNQKFWDKQWNDTYEKLIVFLKENNRWPRYGKKGEEVHLYRWCIHNRLANAGTHSGGKRKPLEKWKIDKLKELGFDFVLKDKAYQDKHWNDMYNKLVLFRRQNPNKWPSKQGSKAEANLFNWCRSNKIAGKVITKGNSRKPLEKWKVDKLDSINFNWRRARKYSGKIKDVSYDDFLDFADWVRKELTKEQYNDLNQSGMLIKEWQSKKELME